MNYDDFTIGFARRQTAYKRPELLISNINRLNEICEKSGPLQIIYAGKAHPKDQSGKESIKNILKARKLVNNNIKIAFIHNYDMIIGKMILFIIK